ncbi:MAG: hypothetical protein OZX49_01662 [Immundisolibacter sp.]|nr:hypothetical protein [Immundisolibacter sp.]
MTWQLVTISSFESTTPLPRLWGLPSLSLPCTTTMLDETDSNSSVGDFA